MTITVEKSFFSEGNFLMWFLLVRQFSENCRWCISGEFCKHRYNSLLCILLLLVVLGTGVQSC
jgi:hypothetical protein